MDSYIDPGFIKKKQLSKALLISGPLLLLLLLLIIILNYFNILRLDILFMRVFNQNQLLASVDSRPIYKDSVYEEAYLHYLPKAVNKEALQKTFNLLIERVILDREAKKLNISISDKEVKKRLFEAHLTIPLASTSATRLTQFRYDLLKERVSARSLESRRAFTVSIWVPPTTYTVLPSNLSEDEVTQKRSQAEKLLTEAEKRLKKGELVPSVARTLYDKYPLLRTSLAINGHSFEKTVDQKLIGQPLLYTYDPQKIDRLLYKTIFSLKKDEVKLLLRDDGSGGWVIQITEVNPGIKGNYKEWLNKKKQELVKIYRQP